MSYRRSISLSWLVLAVVVLCFTNLQAAAAHATAGEMFLFPPQISDNQVDLAEDLFPSERNNPGIGSLLINAHLPTHPIRLGEERLMVIEVMNNGESSLSSVQLQLPNHQDVFYQVNQETPMTPMTDATINLEDMAAGEVRLVEVVLQVRGLPRDRQIPLTFQAKAAGVEPATTSVDLTVTELFLTQMQIPAQGKKVDMYNGRFAFNFPSGWQKQRRDFKFNLLELHQLTDDEYGTIIAFEVEAFSGNQEISQFDREIGMEIQIGDLVDLSQYPIERLVVTSRENKEMPWQKTPANFDRVTGKMHVESSHFSEYKISAAPSDWSLTYTPPSASDYTGAAQYQTGFDLPLGIGGLTPSLGLSYSSRGVDDASWPTMSRGFGLGWSLTIPQIINGNAQEMYENDDNFSLCTVFDANRMILVLNGASHHLTPKGSLTEGRYGKYIASGDPSLFIEYVRGTSLNSPPNITGEYWLVKTADGTTYRFGYTEKSEQVVAPLKGTCSDPGMNGAQLRNAGKFVAASWHLDLVTDRHNNKIEYTYENHCGTRSSGVRQYSRDDGSNLEHCTEIDIALDKIHYNFNGNTPQTIVDFTYEYSGEKTWLNNDMTGKKGYMLTGRVRPYVMDVRHNGQTVNRYLFTYEHGRHDFPTSNDNNDNDSEFWMLKTIKRFGTNLEISRLPLITFTYNQNIRSGCHVSDGVEYCAKLLTHVNNGYGAVTQFIYDRVDDDGNKNSNGRWFYVTDVYTWDGVSHIQGTNQAASRTIYERDLAVGGTTSACFDKDGQACRTPYADESETLVGFSDVVIKIQGPNGSGGWQTLSQTKETFYFGSYWLNGRPKTITQYEPDGEKVIGHTVQTWGLNGRHARLTKQDNYLYVNGSEVAHTYQTHTYDDAGYGAVLWTKEYDNNGIRRCTQHKYAHQVNSIWLVNLPLRETLYAGDCNTKLAETLYRYDNSSSMLDNSITDGNLSWVLTWAGDGNYISTYHEYNERGLLQLTRTFDDLSVSSGPYANEIRTETEIMAFTNLGLPLSAEIRGDGVPTQTQSATYDTVFPWLPASITDMLGNTTQFAYSDFGRLHIVAQPGDSLSSPTIVYNYSDDWAGLGFGPLLIDTVYKHNLQPSERRFYNGLGQLVQLHLNRVSLESVDPKDILTTYDYDATGQLICQTVPYPITAYQWNNKTPYKDHTCASYLHTTTHYDSLGRPIHNMAPDGTTTRLIHGWLSNYSVDANMQLRGSYSDTWGRLTAVDEFVDTFTDRFNDSSSVNNWPVFGSGGSTTVSAGQLVINNGGTNQYGFMRTLSTTEDEDAAVTFSFMADKQAAFWFALMDGGWGTDSFRNWGLHVAGGELKLQEWRGNSSGANQTLTTLMPFKPNTWYQVLIRTSQANDRYFSLVVWEKENPSIRAEIRKQKIDDGWFTNTWKLNVKSANVPGVNLYLDDYLELNTYRTRYQYDLLDNLIQVTDSANNVTQMNYDVLGRKTSMDDPDMGHWEYEYDISGNLIEQLDANGSQLCFNYDSFNRLINKSKTSSICPTTPITSGADWLASYQYDDTINTSMMRGDTPVVFTAGQVGQLTQVSWPGDNGVDYELFGYDEQGRLVHHGRVLDGREYLMSYGEYDPENRPLMQVYPDGEVVRVTYDKMGANSLVAGGDLLVNNVTHNASGQIKLLDYGTVNDSLNIAYDYDPYNGRLTRLSAHNDSTLDLHYGYDSVGNIIGILDGINNETSRYTYDSVNRLTDFDTSGRKQITVRAKGSEGDGWPIMQLRVNGALIEEWTVSSSYADYTIDAPLTGNDQIDIVFTNNYCVPTDCANTDRNLYVDYFIVDGQTIEPNSDIIYDRGSGAAAFDGKDILDGQETLFWNGALRAQVITDNGWNDVEAYEYSPIGNIELMIDALNGESRDYNYGSQIHAVNSITRTTGIDLFNYDANGNMTFRQDIGGTYTQVFDTENRLTTVENLGHGNTLFRYDASGQRTKTVKPDGTIIYTPFPVYEEEILTSIPTVDITADGQDEVALPPNQPFTLAWTSTDAISCEASGEWMQTGLNTSDSQSKTSPASSGTYQYTMTCVNGVGISQSDSVLVHVNSLPYVDSFTANGQSMLYIKSSESFTLSWSSSYADSCDLSWSNSQNTSGNQVISGLSEGSYDYTVVCHSSIGSSEPAVVAVNVVPTPTVAFTANGETNLSIGPNTSFLLEWNSNDANNCVAGGSWSGNKALTGSETVTSGDVGTSDTYTITCENEVDTGTESIQVTVQSLPVPTVSLTADGSTALTIMHDVDFVLQWSSSGADSCVASGDWSGNVALSGSQTMTGFASGSQTYTLSCDNGYGSTNQSVVVTAIPEIQAQEAFVVGDTLYQSFWRENKNWRRTVPIVNDAVDWNQAESWSGPFADDTLPGSGEIQSLTGFAIGNTVTEVLWRNNAGWLRTVPVVNGAVSWDGASGWTGPYSDAMLPGSRDTQSGAAYVLNNYLVQIYSRNGQVYYNTVPIVSGAVDWNNPSAWISYNMSAYPDSGIIQAQASYIIDDTLYYQVWQNDQSWEQSVPIVNGQLDLANASAWVGPTDYSMLPVEVEASGESANLVADVGVNTLVAKPTHLARLATVPVQQGSDQIVIQRSTYALAGQTIAVRVSGDPDATKNGLFYLYSDHLGSTSAIQKEGSTDVEQARYLPFGEWRTEPGNLPTNRGFTGHMHNNLGGGADDLGLIYMNARFYLPGIGRFASADTIVPNPTNPQSLNRYSYTRNSPVNFTDPTGHRECGDDCNDPLSATGITWIAPFSSPYIEFTGSGWQRETKQTIHGGASRMANRMANAVNPLLRFEAKMDGNGFVPLSPEEVWAGTFDGPITFNKTNAPCVVTRGCLAWMDKDAARQINVHSMTYAEHGVHEIFHILDLKVLGGVPSQALRAVQASDPTFPRRPGGLTEDSRLTWGFGSGVIGPYQKSYSNDPAEEFADMGIGWTYNTWEEGRGERRWSTQGQARANFMGNMGLWLSVKLNQ